MASTYQSAAVVTIAGVDYDPISLQLTKDDNWSPVYQATCTLATASLVAPTLFGTANGIPNPSAAVDLAGVVATSCTVTRQAPASGFGSAHGTAYRLTGTNSLFGQITVGGGAGGMRNGMQAGRTYTASGTFFVDVAMSGAANAYARSIVVTAVVGGVQTIVASSAQGTNAPQAQSRLSITYTVPAGATAVWIEWYHGHSSTSVAYWTDLMIVSGTEPDGSPIPFFDGDSLDTVLYQYDWLGGPSNSTSTRTPVFASTSTTPIVDPRTYPKVRVRQWAGDAIGAGALPLYDVLLTVRTYAIDDVADTVTLTLLSDEIKLQDYGNVGGDYAPGAMWINDMVAFAMHKIGDASSFPSIPTGNVVIPATATVWRAGQSLDDWLLGAARSLGYEFWYDPTRDLTGNTNGWRWYGLNSGLGRDIGAANIALNCAYGSNVIESAFGVDMDAGNYADAVVMAYSWTDAAGASQRSAFYARPAGAYRKSKLITLNGAPPGGDPAPAMRAILSRQGWTQRLVLIASTGWQRNGSNPATPAAMALGGSVYITRRDGSVWEGICSRLTYQYPEDTQEVGVSGITTSPAGPGSWSAYYPIPGR